MSGDVTASSCGRMLFCHIAHCKIIRFPSMKFQFEKKYQLIWCNTLQQLWPAAVIWCVRCSGPNIATFWADRNQHFVFSCICSSLDRGFILCYSLWELCAFINSCLCYMFPVEVSVLLQPELTVIRTSVWGVPQGLLCFLSGGLGPFLVGAPYRGLVGHWKGNLDQPRGQLSGH